MKASLVLAASLHAFTPARAATDTWVGSTTVNFSAVNGFNTVPVNGDTLVFGVVGAAGTALNNDIANLVLAAANPAISFTAAAPAYTIGGNAITLGTGTGSASITNASSALQTFGATINYNLASSFVLTLTPGTGGLSFAALNNTSTGNNTINVGTGTVTIGSLGLGSGGTGVIFNGSGNVIVNGAVSQAANAPGFQFQGTGTLTLNGTNTNTGTNNYNTTTGGGTTIIAGNGTAATGATAVGTAAGPLSTLTINGAAGKLGGSLAATNATVNIDNSSVLLANRLNSKAVTLTNSTLNYTSNNGALASAESVAALTTNSGANTINLISNATSATTLTATSIARSGTGGTLLITGNNLGGALGANTVNIIPGSNGTNAAAIGGGGAAGTTTISIENFILGRDTALTGNAQYGLVTDAGTLTTTGLRNLTAAEYANTIAAGTTTTNNVSLTTTIPSLAGTTTINALRLDTGGGVDIGGTLTVSAGTILALNGNTGISNGTLAFGTREAIFRTVDNLSVSSAITGSGGLTKSDAGTLTLSGANTYTGTTSINQGTLKAGVINALGSAAVVTIGNMAGATLDITGFNTAVNSLAGGGTAGGSVVLGNATLTNNATTSTTYAGSITGTSGGTGTYVLGGTGVNTLSGAISNANLVISNPNATGSNGTQGQILSAAITGTSSVSITGGGSVSFSGVNTSSGGLTIKSGLANITSAAASTAGTILGTGTITLGDAANTGTAATLGLNQSFVAGAFNNALNVVGNGLNSLGGTNNFPIFAGAITLNSNNLTIFANNVNNSNTTLGISGGITGIGNIIVDNRNALGTSNINLTTTAINNAGTITHTGLNIGTDTISAAIGSSVTGVTQNSATSALTLSGLNSFTGGITIKAGTVNVSGQALGVGTNIGTITLGDVANTGLAATFNASNNLTGLSNNAINVVGTGSRTISVTSFNPTFSGAVTLNSTNLNVITNNTGGSNLTLTGGITGAGNLVLQSNGNLTTNVNSKVIISTGAVNNVGTITNSGTGTIGGTAVAGATDTTINSVIGPNVTGVIQNSANSALILSGSNTYTGDTTITTGNLVVNNTNALRNSVLVRNGGSSTFGATISSARIGGLAGSTNLALVNTAGTPGAVDLTLGHSNVANGSGTNPNTLNPTYSGVISGLGTVTKLGSNTQTLSGINTYTGTTTVSAGTLLISGSLAAGSVVTVDGSGSLGGSGTTGVINGATTVLGGARLGSLDGAASTLTFTTAASGGVDISAAVSGFTGGLVFELAAVGSSDQFVLNGTGGTLNIGSGVLEFDDFSFTALTGFGAGTYTLFDTTSGLLGSLGSNLSGSIGSFTGALSMSGNDLILTVAPVPEPSTYALLGLGLVSLYGLRRKARKTS